MKPKLAWADISVAEVISPEAAPVLLLLVTGLLDGDAQAETKFYQLFSRLVRTIAKHYQTTLAIKHADYEVDDIVNMAFGYLMKGYRYTVNRDFNTNNAPLGKWLQNPKIPLHKFVALYSRRYMLDLLRKVDTPPFDSLSDTAIQDRPDAGLNNPEKMLVKKDEERRVRYALRSALQELPLIKRIVYQMKYVEELSNIEISRRLNINQSTVSRHVDTLTRTLPTQVQRLLQRKRN
jgi:RNA polymerase sigma factor (sigma-70 family)